MLVRDLFVSNQFFNKLCEVFQVEHVGTVAEGVVGVGVYLEEEAVSAEGFGCLGHCWHEASVA